ncbi:MAG: YdiY family protein, partial [Phycisphaerae bacterium]
KIPFDMSRMTALWPEDGKSPEVLALEAQVEEMKPKYVFTAEAGITYQEGNTNQLVARGKVVFTRTTKDDLLTVFLSGDYAEQNEVRSAAEVKTGFLYELNFTERAFWYLRADAEYDEFENLEFRGQAFTGLGYYFIKKPKHELKTRAGIGFIHETFFDGFTRTDPQAEVGLDYRIDINESLQFVSSNTWLPTFNSLRDYRLISDNAFIIPLAQKQWKLKLGALYEYDPIPRPGFQRLDQTYYANILVEIK